MRQQADRVKTVPGAPAFRDLDSQTEKPDLPFERETLDQKSGTSVAEQRNSASETREGENPGKEECPGGPASYPKEHESNQRRLLKHWIRPGYKQLSFPPLTNCKGHSSFRE